ncbi:hypothetical protein F2Q70_00006940 [Brassica cretica]|uniref:BnaCnng04000D protein n=6 Tax=Brassica TaxID=3705 RepID=A0A078FBZ4_BRANA|nr:hypothetical protein F2Q68_00023615 [Brassica cretica]KAF2571820.1 hypothetical protein F2Q70_00006940 [Brassica cretica]KAH0861770.1 hypothetical protein HID58_090031 [Brassica napus]CDY10499.1 BnaCnng04000D [Brassica napus]VDD34877.1 unnamed protein product [Brassica oleracea]
MGSDKYRASNGSDQLWRRVIPFGTYTTGPPFIREWNMNVMRLFRIYYNLSGRVRQKLEKTVPGFNIIMGKVQKDYESRIARRMKWREEEMREEDLGHNSGHSDEDEEEEEEEGESGST